MKAHLLNPETRKWWTLAAVAFGLFMIGAVVAATVVRGERLEPHAVPAAEAV